MKKWTTTSIYIKKLELSRVPSWDQNESLSKLRVDNYGNDNYIS